VVVSLWQVVVGILLMIVSVFACLFGLHALNTLFNGVALLRRDLARRRIEPVVIEAIVRDLDRRGSSAVMPFLAFAAGVGLVALAFNWDENLLAPGVGLVALSPVWLGWTSVRNRRGGPLHRVLVGEPAVVRLLVETRVSMPQLLPGSSRQYRLVDVPHVVVVTSLGEEILVEDDGAQTVLRAMSRHLPSALCAQVPRWCAGLGRTLVGSAAGAPGHA
jgi:hypothetical protein